METSVGGWFQGPLVLSLFAPNYNKSYNVSITRSLRFIDYFIPFFLNDTQNGSQFKGVFCAKGEVSSRRVLLKTTFWSAGLPSMQHCYRFLWGGHSSQYEPHQLQDFHSCWVSVCQQTLGNYINSIHLEHIRIYVFLLRCFSFKQARLPNLDSLFHSCCVNLGVCQQTQGNYI